LAIYFSVVTKKKKHTKNNWNMNKGNMM